MSAEAVVIVGAAVGLLAVLVPLQGRATQVCHAQIRPLEVGSRCSFGTKVKLGQTTPQ